MLEGLKNAGPTFTRMTGEVFKPQINRNVLAYVDDIIVKSDERLDHIKELAETFARLQEANLKLNLENMFLVFRKEKFWVVWYQLRG
jgi:hypothetical protein